MKKLIILFLLLTATVVHAQTDRPLPCATDSMWKDAVKKDPDALLRRRQLNEFTKRFVGLGEKTISPTGVVVFKIPVVFHVIHEYGVENISKAQVQDAVRILNLSYQKLNPDTGSVAQLFKPIFADCQIEFRLANLDPNGNCTDGITRTYSTLTETAGDNVKSLVDWPNDQYLNIWVVKHIASGAAGYAYYPGISSNIDGVVILHDYVGSFGTSNGTNYSQRSLTHEVGHWLNLPHTWGSTNTPGAASNCGIDDGISDTPNTIGCANFGCDTTANACGPIANVQNYMDYCECHYMFTNGQKAVMHAALNGPAGGRSNLNTISNLTATGTEDGHVVQSCTPVADFTSVNYVVCQGSTITFKYLSWGGDVVSRVWSFQGGTPATDTSAMPTVSYAAPGNYSVTLTVMNASGTDSLIRTNFVNVLPSPGANSIPYSESFEAITFPGTTWTVLNPGNNNAWTQNSVAAATGVKSVRLINQSGNAQGSKDMFLSPTYNLTNKVGASLTFKLAFAAKSASDSSILKVYASNDCGATWLLRYTKKQTALQTSGVTNASFVPTAAAWRTETISLSSPLFSGQPSVRLKFEYTNDLGNNIYIDDININAGTVGLSDQLAEQYDFKAWPNPAHEQLQVKLERAIPASVRLELYDMLGRKVDETTPSDKSSGEFQISLSCKNYLGMYILKVIAGSDSFEQRVTFVK